MANIKKILLVFGIILVFGLFLVFGTQSENQEIVYFGGPKNINMLPIVAQETGIFESHGLKTERKDIQTGTMAINALVKGDIDFATVVETTVAFAGFQEYSNVEIIAIIEEKFDDAIMVNKDKNILKPGDLKGRRIGITKGTTSHAFAVFYLKNLGISLNDGEFANMPPPSIQAALINGDLDAGSLWQPYRHNVEKELGNKSMTLNDKEAYKAYSIILVRKDFAEKNFETVKKFLKSLIDAEKYYKENPTKIKEIISREINVPLEILENVWDEYILEISLKKELKEIIKKEAEWIIEIEEDFKGKQIPSYEGILNYSFLEEVDSARVNAT